MTKKTRHQNPKQQPKKKNITDPEEYVIEIFQEIDPGSLESTYNIDSWTDAMDFVEQVALRTGKLLKGGMPDTQNTARYIVNDWRKGRLRRLVKMDRGASCKQSNSQQPAAGHDPTPKVAEADAAEVKTQNTVEETDLSRSNREAKKAKDGCVEERADKKLSCKERRAKERSEQKKGSSSNFYEFANAKNKRNRPTNKETDKLGQRRSSE